MRRLRSDLPYRFRPPKVKPWLRPLVLAVNRHQQLRRNYRVPKPAINDRVLRLATGVLALKETEFLSVAGQGG